MLGVGKGTMMKSRTKLILLFAAIAAVVVLVLVASGTLGALSKGKKAPDFKAKTLKGTEFELKDLRGRVVLMDFWATWCPPCRREVPELEKLWKKYKDKGLVVLGIALDRGSSDVVRKFVAKYKLTYWQVHDARSEIARKYDIRPIPTTYIVDTKGVIRDVHVGFGPGLEKEFEKEIKALLPSPEELRKLKPLPPLGRPTRT